MIFCFELPSMQIVPVLFLGIFYSSGYEPTAPSLSLSIFLLPGLIVLHYHNLCMSMLFAHT